jgi:hypothetical protein
MTVPTAILVLSEVPSDFLGEGTVGAPSWGILTVGTDDAVFFLALGFVVFVAERSLVVAVEIADLVGLCPRSMTVDLPP